MTTPQQIITKYGLTKIERNGRTGVQPLRGNITASDAAYIKANKDAILAILDERSAKSKAELAELSTVSDADISYQQTVAPLEAKYRRLERTEVAAAISAKAEYETALAEWQRRYPEAAQTSNSVHYNNAPTNIWTL